MKTIRCKHCGGILLLHKIKRRICWIHATQGEGWRCRKNRK